MEVLGAVIGIVTISAMYVCTMTIYFALRRWRPEAKIAIEIWVASFAILASIVIKSAIAWNTIDIPHAFEKGFSAVLYALYAGIGGLTFEGLSIDGNISHILLSLYTLSSIYAGAVALSVITAKVSYEVHSGLSLAGFRVRSFFGGNADVFVFTDVTEDALLLVKSIKQKYQEKGKNKAERKRYKIIFAGTALSAFDRKNPLHLEVMRSGALYWPLAKKSKQTSLLQRLHVGMGSACHLLQADLLPPKKSPRQVHLFALRQTAEMTGKEASNSDLIFDEIQFLAKRCFEKNSFDKMVHLYVLTNTEIDTEFYQRAKKDRIKAAARSAQWKKGNKRNQETSKSKLERDTEEKTAKAVCTKNIEKSFQLHVFNEAALAASCLSAARVEHIMKMEQCAAVQSTQKTEVLRQGYRALYAQSVPDSNNLYRVLVLGFGKTGQMAMARLYHDTAYISQNEPSHFVCDVYEKEAAQRSGLFRSTHPMFVNIAAQDAHPLSVAELQKGNPRVQELLSSFSDAVVKSSYVSRVEQNGEMVGLDKNSDLDTQNYILEQMAPPVVSVHSTDVFSDEFTSMLRKEQGEKYKMVFAFRSVIVTLGGDEQNIAAANAFIKEYRRAEIENQNLITNNVDKDTQTTVFVHLRDDRNRHRIAWDNQTKGSGLNVVHFGSALKMYDCNRFIAEQKPMIFHYYYQSAEGNVTRYRTDAEAFKPETFWEKLSVGCVDDNADVLAEYKKIKRVAIDEIQMRKKWLGLDLVKKESNRHNAGFEPYFSAAVLHKLEKNGGKLLVGDMMQLVRLEHERWNRFHIGAGFGYYYAKKVETEKLHNCLCPFEMVPCKNRPYDMCNVLLAYDALQQALQNKVDKVDSNQ